MNSMPRIYERIVAKRILHVLEENLGIGMRFSEIFRALATQGWFHNQKPISENLQFLIREKKVVHIGNQYAIIQTREDETKFCIIKDPVEKVIELGK